MDEHPATRDLSSASDRPRGGRGRGAKSPLQMPRQAWKDILWRTWLSVGEDRVALVAAGVAFYLLLSIVPALTAVLSIYGMVFDPRDVAEQVEVMDGVVPDGVLTFLQSEMFRLANMPNTIGFGLAFSIALGIWGASRAHQAIGHALDVAYGERSRGIIAARVRSLLLAGATAVTGILSLALLVLGPYLARLLGWNESWLLSVARWPVAALVFWLWLTIIYRYAPSRRPARWRWLSIGSLLAAALWMTISALLSWYASELGDLGKTYGSLGGAALLLIWLFGFGYALLLGAELDSEIEHQTVRDSTIGPPKPRGQRGAYVADTVGRAKRPDDSWWDPPPDPHHEPENESTEESSPPER